MCEDDGKAMGPGGGLSQLVTERTPCSELSGIELKLLVLAFTHQFDEPVTAFLTRVQIIAASCVGETHRHVRADSRGQFQDGHRIRTSDIRAAFRVGPFWCVRTFSGSLYVLVTFHDEGGEASFDEFLQLYGGGIHPAPHRYH